MNRHPQRGCRAAARRAPGRSSVLAAACGAAALFAPPGCDRGKPSQTAGQPDRGPPSAVYTVRGQIAELLDPSRPQSEFRIHHEAIDDFANADGRVVGMGSMTMGFPLGPGVKTDGLKAGDIVEITFPVWWKGGASDYYISTIRKLPPETKLDFRAARPPEEAKKPTPPG